MMKIIDVSIQLIDILDTSNKEKFDSELTALQITPPINDAEWKSSPISRGRRKSFTLNSVPGELEFLSSININLVQYENFASSIMVTIEGKLTAESIAIFANQGYEENKNLLEERSKKIWNVWKEKIKSTILVDNEITITEPLVLYRLKFDVDNYAEVVNNAEESNSNNDKHRSTILTLSKYGVNTLGLISLLFATDKEFSILAQNRSVYRSDSFDYTGLSILIFKSSTWDDDFENSTPMYKILLLMHLLFWLQIRKQQIFEWKNKIGKLSDSIREFERKLLEPNAKKMDLSIYEQKGLFQTEYASFMDERRFITKITTQQIQQQDDIYHGEKIILNQTTKQIPGISGLFTNISSDILNLVENLKEEYDVIKEQYKILGEELSGILSLSNSQSILKLSSEGQKTQSSMKRQGNIMIFFTIAIFSLTGVLLYFTIHQYFIENFDPFVTASGGEVKIYGGYYPSYNSEPEIKVGAATNHFLSFTVTNVKFLGGSTLSNCYFTKKPDDVKLWTNSPTIVGKNGNLESLKPFVAMDFSVNSTYWDSLYTNEKKIPSVVGTLIYDIEIADLQDTSKKHLHEQVYGDIIANLSQNVVSHNCHS